MKYLNDVLYVNCFFFCKQKTAYEMRISDWSSDVCSSDLQPTVLVEHPRRQVGIAVIALHDIGSAHPQLADFTGRHVGPAYIDDTNFDTRNHRRSEARRVGQECVSTCRSRWSPYH